MKQSIDITHPHLVSSWHPRNPPIEKFTMGMVPKVWWVCEQGHEWEASPNNRCGKSSKCPYCSGKRPVAGETDLATMEPIIASEWHPDNPLPPDTYTRNSGKKVMWLCDSSHAWEAKISNRVTLRQGCPVCSGLAPDIGVNDLATLYPSLALSWSSKNNDAPSAFLPGSSKKAWWMCSKGHPDWYSTIHSRTNGHGCPLCVTIKNPKIELDLLALLSKEFEVVLHYDTALTWGRGRNPNTKVIVDLYIPALNIVIEYDGKRWHEPKREVDTYKSQKLLDAGFRVIRLRQNHLFFLNIEHANYYELDFPWATHDKLATALVPLISLCHRL